MILGRRPGKIYGAGHGDGGVYFLRPAGEEGPVKIGISVSPRGRCYECQKWSPVILELAAVIYGANLEDERRFHQHFYGQWSHSEWFHASDELSAVIRAIQAETFDLETLEPYRGVNVLRCAERFEHPTRQIEGIRR